MRAQVNALLYVLRAGCAWRRLPPDWPAWQSVYYLTDLAPVLECYGNRGYRIAQVECALYAGKLQLAARALGLGTVGSTSYDEVIQFFSPDAAGKAYMFVVVFGSRRQRGS